MVAVLSEEQSYAHRCVLVIGQCKGECDRSGGRDAELTSLPDSWGRDACGALDKQWATSPPSRDVFTVHLDKHSRHEMPWPGALGRAHNPEVTGSNPVPATRSTSANEKGPDNPAPFVSPPFPRGSSRSAFPMIAAAFGRGLVAVVRVQDRGGCGTEDSSEPVAERVRSEPLDARTSHHSGEAALPRHAT